MARIGGRRTRIGSMWHRMAFDKRRDVNPDSPADLGNTQSVFEEQFVVWAAIEPRLGGETVMAARLTGVQTLVITVRQTSATRSIKLDWRMRNVNEGGVFAISSIVDSKDDGEFLDILVQSGVAQ